MGQQAETETGQDIIAAELEEVERLDREATPGPWVDGPHLIERAEGVPIGEIYEGVDRAFIIAARTLLPRLARAYRARLTEACDAGDRAVKAVDDAYTRGRREAVEEAARYLDERGEVKGDSVLFAAAEWLKEHEAEIQASRERGSK